jgi:hypothetical protein
MREPHLLLAGSNPRRLKQNLAAILPPASLDAIELAIRANVKGLFDLGETHYAFACSHGRKYWRQCTSRLYFGSYAVYRSVRLEVDGHYSTESSEHRRVGDMPADFLKREQFRNQLTALREDRKLADYDHTATESDLVRPVADAILTVEDFLATARSYLTNRGVTL